MIELPTQTRRSAGRETSGAFGRRDFLAGVILVGLSLCGSTQAGDETALEQFSAVEICFGVPIGIELYVADEAIAKAAIKASYAKATQFDVTFSDYDPDSEARQLAAKPPGVWHPASAELVSLSQRSRAISETTCGVFDVSVGPLTHLWRKTMRFRRHPDAGKLADALSLVGNDRWDVREDAIRFAQPGMRLDFGGVAKGAALDAMGAVMKSHGVTQFLIDAGGDILCGDPPPGRAAWRIEVERPAENRNGVRRDAKPLLLEVRNRAVATSGATYQSVTLDGIRYSHIVDPRTGYGVERLSNVTVEADEGWLADALASAVSVGGTGSVSAIKTRYPTVVIRISDSPEK